MRPFIIRKKNIIIINTINIITINVYERDNYNYRDYVHYILSNIR